MTLTDAMLAECLDEVEDVLRSHQHRRFDPRTNAWAQTTVRAFKLNGRLITMHLTVDVSALETPPDDIA
jgi:hypothetical protein